MTTQLMLIRVVIRGAGQPGDSDVIGGVEVRREDGSPNAIYLTFLKPSWRSDVRYPARNDARMKITPATMPLSKSVGVEFCGSDIDLMIASAGAQGTVEGAVRQITPLLRYYEDNFSVA